jgi:hypothetical protein
VTRLSFGLRKSQPLSGNVYVREDSTTVNFFIQDELDTTVGMEKLQDLVEHGL